MSEYLLKAVDHETLRKPYSFASGFCVVKPVLLMLLATRNI